MADKDKAVDFVLGALTPDERLGVAVRRRFDRELDRAIAALEAALSPMVLAGGSLRPDRGLWNRILAALAAERQALAGKHVEPIGEGRWSSYADRIEVKTLWDEASLLIRCEPGACDPSHVQEQDEHVIVVAGDLLIGGRRFATGDYLLFPRAGRHPEMRTDGGCILFVQYR